MAIDTSKATTGKSEKELSQESEEAIKKVVGANAEQDASSDVEIEQSH